MDRGARQVTVHGVAKELDMPEHTCTQVRVPTVHHSHACFYQEHFPGTQHVVRALVVFTFSFLVAFLVLLNIVPKTWKIPRVSPNCCLKLTNDSQVHGGIQFSCLLNITNGMLRGPSNSSHPEAQGPHGYFVQSKEGGRFPWSQKL